MEHSVRDGVIFHVLHLTDQSSQETARMWWWT